MKRASKTMDKEIVTVEDARKFILCLIEKDLMFHLDDDVDDIIWDKDVPRALLETIKKRHEEIWNVGNPWEYAEDIINNFLESLRVEPDLVRTNRGKRIERLDWEMHLKDCEGMMAEADDDLDV
ncbi:MAG: hypothetical protein CL489_17760 [Acidobacteria bacterium]|nr:hypothetical protein [Acidobacteriota bacterium]